MIEAMEICIYIYMTITLSWEGGFILEEGVGGGGEGGNPHGNGIDYKHQFLFSL